MESKTGPGQVIGLYFFCDSINILIVLILIVVLLIFRYNISCYCFFSDDWQTTTIPYICRSLAVYIFIAPVVLLTFILAMWNGLSFRKNYQKDGYWWGGGGVQSLKVKLLYRLYLPRFGYIKRKKRIALFLVTVMYMPLGWHSTPRVFLVDFWLHLTWCIIDILLFSLLKRFIHMSHCSEVHSEQFQMWGQWWRSWHTKLLSWWRMFAHILIFTS